MLTPSELTDLLRLTSHARLSSYSQYLGTTNSAEAYGAYMWSTAVSAAFAPLVQAVEISLRNVLHDALSAGYGPAWYEHWVAQEKANLVRKKVLQTSQQSEGERLIKKAKTKVRSRLNMLPNQAPPTQRVLAELTFGFWVRFLSRFYWDVNNRTKLWPNHLPAAFPGAPSPMQRVGALHSAFDQAVGMRNRIHHQEPLWKGPGVTSAASAVSHLQGELQTLLTLLDFMGPAKKTSLEKFGAIAAVEELCSKASLDRFMGRHRGEHTLLSTAKRSLLHMSRKAGDSTSIWICDDAMTPRLVIRNGNRRFF